MIEEFRRGDKWWEIVLGFGRIQRARSIYTEHLPERAKRALLANANVDGQNLLKDVPPDELQRYNENTGNAVLVAVLHSAHDWDGKNPTPEVYVNDSLPEDVGEEILKRVRSVISESALEPSVKKN